MPNTYFQFKQFTVHQEHCAMKVCTDACLFGAWVAEKAGGNEITTDRVLDIGTGTGLLCLMLAQQSAGMIDAIEIDEAAAKQADENFAASPWKSRLKVYHSPIQVFSQPGNLPYDLILSNPPFFEHDLKSDDHKRNLALHSNELKLDELLSAVDRLLSPNGYLAILLPFHRNEAFKTMALEKGYYLHHAMAVKQTPQHNYFRSMFLFGRKEVPSMQSGITIREKGLYTDSFRQLLKDYYLYLT